MNYIKKYFYCFFICILFCSTSYGTDTSRQEEIYLAHIQEGMQLYHDEGEFTYLTEEQISSYSPMFLKMYRKEKEHSAGYFQVITGMPSRFLALQVILKEHYRLIDDLEFEDYEFIRARSNAYKNIDEFLFCYPDLLRLDELLEPSYSFYDKYQLMDKNGHVPRNIMDLIEEPLKSTLQEEMDGIDALINEKYKKFVTDNNPTVSDHLISASFSIETSSSMDSAHYVFVTGNGMSPDKEKDNFIYEKLKNLGNYYNLTEESFKALIENLIESCPKSKEGILMQIFIPKEQAKEMMYVSLAGGMQADQKYLNLLHEGYANTSGSNDLEKFYNYFETVRLSENFDIDENYQVRLLADSLRPDKVKIFRYTTISQEILNDYQEYVRSSLWTNMGGQE